MAQKKSDTFTILTDSDIRKQIKSGDLSGAYLFFGEEDYLKNYTAKAIKEAVLCDPVFSVFNEVSMEFGDFTPFALENALMSPPMGMTGEEKKIITVHGFSFNGAKASFIDDLVSAISLIGELTYNILVIIVPPDCIDAGKLPSRPSALLKRLAQYMTIVNFPEQTPARLCAWVGKHFEHFGINASAQLCSYLISRCGKSMYILSSEIEKLAFYLLANNKDTVTEQDIDLVTCPELDCDAYALTNAIISGDRAAAISVLEVLKFRRVDPIMILGEISSTLHSMAKVAAAMKEKVNSADIAKATGIHEFRVKMFMQALSVTDVNSPRDGRRRLFDAMTLCAEADLRLKSGTRGYEPIEIMLCGI